MKTRALWAVLMGAVLTIAFAWLAHVAPGPVGKAVCSMPEFVLGLLSLLFFGVTVLAAFAAVLGEL